MPDRTREESEFAVVEAVKQWLPELVEVGSVIEIKAVSPAENEGACFEVAKQQAFVCRRGS